MTSDQGVTASALARGRWRRLPAAPIADCAYPVGVWTGRELLVWGGGWSGSHVDGAAYDPVRHSWRRVPPAPLPPRRGVAAAWTGRELIVWGGYEPLVDCDGVRVADDGAAYDPVADTWRRLPPAPPPACKGATAVWTGREVLVVGGTPPMGSEPDRRDVLAGAAYDPAHDSWRRLAPSPQLPGSLMGRRVVWAGTRLLVWSGWERVLRSEVVKLADGSQAGSVVTLPGGEMWAYDPSADRWSVLPPAPGQPFFVGEVLVWIGREVVSVGGRAKFGLGLPGGRYDPARNRWEPLAAGPLDGAAGLVELWTGAALLVWNGNSMQGGAFEAGDGAAWDPAADRWVRLPRSPLGVGDGPVGVWTGRAALIWGGMTRAGHTGMVFTPGS